MKETLAARIPDRYQELEMGRRIDLQPVGANHTRTTPMQWIYYPLITHAAVSPRIAQTLQWLLLV